MDQVDTLKQSGVREVVIDTSRERDVDEGTAAEPDETRVDVSHSSGDLAMPAHHAGGDTVGGSVSMDGELVSTSSMDPASLVRRNSRSPGKLARS